MMVHHLARVPRITIGPGARSGLAGLAGGLVPAGAPVLLVADPGLAPTGVVDEVAGRLRRGGFPVVAFTDIKSDPSETQADAAAELARSMGAELLVALGGGSALDLGKAVACVARANEPARHYALGAVENDRAAHHVGHRFGDDPHRHSVEVGRRQALAVGR